jgi:hypothetical protein
MPWIPGRRRGLPFLADLPRHSETAIIALQSGKPRKRKLVSRALTALVLRWRYYVTASIAMTIIVSLVGTILILTRDAFIDPNKLPTQPAPTLEELNNSIALGERYLNALYKPLPDGEAVQSEASGVPLKAYFPDEKVWVLLGEDKTECSGGPDDCEGTTSLGSDQDDPTHDRYTASFSTPTKRAALNVKVELNWAVSKTQYQVQVTPEDVKAPVELWLDNSKLVEFKPGSKDKAERTFNNDEQSSLRMLRFTVRHATQEAYLYWATYGNNPARAGALKKFLERTGFTPGFDLRAPLFDQGDNLPDDLPTNDQSYPDCQITAAETQYAYAYRSRVCLFESLYIDNGERDPFLQSWAALTILMKYDDPNHQQPQNGQWTQGDTPQEVSTHLRGQWNRSGWGIPKCTPFSCGELSGIRTSVFGALETQLGYRFKDDRAKLFADAAAKITTQTQVGPDGKIVADNGNTYFRPGQVGSYLSAWLPPDLKFTQPSTPALPVAVALYLKGARPTPVEYQGIIPSNSETTLDALGFLQMYRCAKYKVCG